MSKVPIKTNNDLSLINLKIKLRVDSISKFDRPVKVLELFGGEGVLWKQTSKQANKQTSK